MKKFNLSIFILLLIANTCYSQWEQMPGPHGMKINVFYKYNYNILAGTMSYGVTVPRITVQAGSLLMKELRIQLFMI